MRQCRLIRARCGASIARPKVGVGRWQVQRIRPTRHKPHGGVPPDQPCPATPARRGVQACAGQGSTTGSTGQWPLPKGPPGRRGSGVDGAREASGTHPQHVPTGGWPRWLRANRGSHPGHGDRQASSRAAQCTATGHPALKAVPRLGMQASSRQPRHDSVMTGLARSEWRTGPARLDSVQTGVSMLKPPATAGRNTTMS